MEQLKMLKNQLLSHICSNMGNLNDIDTHELKEALEAEHYLEEAIYYCTIVEAMEKKDDNKEKDIYYYREMYPRENYSYPAYYYGQGNTHSGTPMPNSGGARGGNQGSNSSYYTEREMPVRFRDEREGRSPMTRRMYMESKELHHDQAKRMKELEDYMKELGEDIMEMIEDATPEEKAILQKKISTLATKINV